MKKKTNVLKEWGVDSFVCPKCGSKKVEVISVETNQILDNNISIKVSIACKKCNARTMTEWQL
jgi:transcription elongation factor Elf1